MSNRVVKCCVITMALASSAVALGAETQMRSRELRMQTSTLPTECPELSGGTLRIESTFNVPSGWIVVPKAYSGMSLKLVNHSVSSGQLWCNYAQSVGPQGYLITTTVRMIIPAGKTCTAEPDFHFNCK